jgi:hypothetical protein
MEINIEQYKKDLFESKVCSSCGKRCQSKRGCLLTQILKEINEERLEPLKKGEKRYKPMTYVALYMKTKNVPEHELMARLSMSKEDKIRYGSFGRTFFSPKFFDRFK